MKWQIKLVSNSGGVSYLINNRGNTQFCLTTARKYANEFMSNFGSDFQQCILCEA